MSRYLRFVATLLIASQALIHISCGYLNHTVEPQQVGMYVSGLRWARSADHVVVYGGEYGSRLALKILRFDAQGKRLSVITDTSASLSYNGSADWAADDSVIYYSATSFLGADLRSFDMFTGADRVLAGGMLYGVNSDGREIVLGPPMYAYSDLQMMILRSDGRTARAQTRWPVLTTPSVIVALWLSPTTVATPERNSLNLEHLVVRDTAGSVLDSFEFPAPISNSSGLPSSIAYSNGTLFVSSTTGITKIDSATKIATPLASDAVFEIKASGDGTFLVCQIASGIAVFNAKTGAKATLIDRTGRFDISPDSRFVAFTPTYADQSPTSITILPVTVP